MNNDLTLLVLAAGMGSRFGGLKQIEPVGPSGEFIIDYSVYDAIKAGFNKVVFVIKEENYEVFKDTIGKRIEDKIKVEYVFQSNDDIKENMSIPKKRVKPLGTGHALYCTRNTINENFALISADDFYGRDAFMKAAEFLRNCNDNETCAIGFKLGNTLTENGTVKRGVIFVEDGYVANICESVVEKKENFAECTPLEGGEKYRAPFDQPVSMLFFGATRKLIDYVCSDIDKFFNDESNDLETCEYLLPNVIFDFSKKENSPIKVINTDSKYYGMTYKEDVDKLKKGILEYIEDGTYKNNLWG